MRSTIPDQLERGRVLIPGIMNDGLLGAFRIQYKERTLRIISSMGTYSVEQGWEHVSVSLQDRIPSWMEMCYVKDLFWEPHECVVQFHPPKMHYKNIHPNCLHMWRNASIEFPLPPINLV